jgi:hypothetical protein
VTHLNEEINRSKATTIRDLGPVDIAPLLDAVLALPEDAWDREEDFEANYNKRGAISQGSHIIFRFSDRRETPYRYLELPVWTAWADRLLPVMHRAVAPYGYANPFFPRVMLARIPAGAFVPPHVDGDAAGHVPHKVHVPLLTNPRAFFFEEGVRHHLAPGRAWEVNNGIPHSVVNGGGNDRVHLIFEVLDGDAQRFLD